MIHLLPFLGAPNFSYGEEREIVLQGQQYCMLLHTMLHSSWLISGTPPRLRGATKRQAMSLVPYRGPPMLLAPAWELGPLRLASQVSIRNRLREDQPQLGIVRRRSRELPLDKAACTVVRIPRDKPLTLVMGSLTGTILSMRPPSGGCWHRGS